MTRKELIKARAVGLFRCAYRELQEGSEEIHLGEALKYAGLIARGPAWFRRYYGAGDMTISESEVEDSLCAFHDEVPGPPSLLPEEEATILHHNEQVRLLRNHGRLTLVSR